MLALPMMAVAQDVTTPEQQQLEQAQKQLEEAKKALEAAKANAEKAKAEAAEAQRKATEEAQKQVEAEKAKIEEERAKVQEETERLKAETERINAEAQKLNQEAQKAEKDTVIPTTSGWSAPVKEERQKPEAKKTLTNKEGVVLKEDPKYLEGAVTVNDEGKVEFELNTDANGKSAAEIYQLVYNYLDTLTQDSHQVDETSRIVLVNPQEHVIACVMKEWLVFQNSFLSLDRTEFNYQLVATITDNHLNMVISRINYNYEPGRSTGFDSPAEDVITDKYALNKKKTDLSRIFGKFRKGTINRKDEIFSNISTIIK